MLSWRPRLDALEGQGARSRGVILRSTWLLTAIASHLQPHDIDGMQQQHHAYCKTRPSGCNKCFYKDSRALEAPAYGVALERPHNSSLSTGKLGKCTPAKFAEGSKRTRLRVIANCVLRCGCAVV